MKFFKWKYFIITGLVCLSPILIGLFLWDKLPENVAIHFDLNNNPDNFATKGFAVFGMPIIMVFAQFFSCFVNDFNAMKHGARKKFEAVTKWIIPAITILLQIATFLVALGYNVDIRVIVTVIVGGMFLILGNYMPKFDYIKNYDIDTEKARKINRFIGYETVIMGILFLTSIFFPPMSTVVCLLLLIPYTIIGVIYGICVAKKK